MLAFKLIRKRKDGSLGPLFIGRRHRYEIGKWDEAKDIPTKGYDHRPGFHCCLTPNAPHLAKYANRVWCLVEVEDVRYYERPVCQGGTWCLAQRMRVLEELEDGTFDEHGMFGRPLDQPTSREPG